mgnify:CR=1 FL=1
MSHPSWVCGLKQQTKDLSGMLWEVTPFVGVWIETIVAVCELEPLFGHTLRGCVD